MGQPPVELFVRLLKQASLISSPMRDCVSASGDLSISEVKILLALQGEGQAAGHDLSEIMGMSAMNVSRAFAQLSDRGLIEPASDHAKRRRKPMQLTAKGREAVAGIMPSMGVLAAELLGVLSPREQEQFDRMSQKIEARLKRWIEEHHGEIHFND